MGYYRRLEEISLQDVLEFGGKAAHLGEAMHLGCPVLPGVVLSSALFRRFMRQGGLQGEIRSILNNLQPRTMAQFQAAEWAIRSAFRVRRMPPEAIAAIRAAWESLGAPRIAVRSSATNEDIPGQSFVGQHAVILNVASPEAAVKAVLTCWASLYSARALSYAHSFGIDLLNSAMAVLMQPMVDPTASGVLLTADPITGNPDTLILSIQTGPQSGVHHLDPYTPLEGKPPFWCQLKDIGLLLEEHYCAYQNVEWVLVDDHVFLLRVRSATNIPPYLPPEAIHDAIEEAPLQWVHPPNVSPRAARPFSWYHQSRGPALTQTYQQRRAFAQLRPAMPREHYICGYLYKTPAAPPETRPKLSLRRRFQNGVFLLRTRSLDRDYLALKEAKEQRLEEMNALALGNASLAEIAAFLQEISALHEAFVGQWGLLERTWETLWEILQETFTNWTPTENPDTFKGGLPPDLTKELERNAQRVYASPQEEERAKERLFHTWRHFFVPDEALAPWQDLVAIAPARERFEEAWQKARDGGLTPNPIENGQNGQPPASSEIPPTLNWLRRLVYERLLRSVQHYFDLCRDCQTKVVLCRLLERDALYEVGKRLTVQGIRVAEDDIALLTYQEILDWLQGAASAAAIATRISERKHLVQRWRRYTPPEQIERPTPPITVQEEPYDEYLQGQPICAGQASGKARVLTRPHDATYVLPGEILVCQELLFELSPLLSIVSAIIAEKGDLLDHASVLVREYGVPTVFGVAQATSRIQTGDILSVDATRGIIMRRAHKASWEPWGI